MSGITNLLGLKSPYQQVVTVAKSGGDFDTIQAAINSITDAASDKIYTVLVYPGSYAGFNLKNYVDVVAVDPEATMIISEVSDNNHECHCYLSLNIASTSGNGLRTENAATVVKVDGNVSSQSISAYCGDGTQIINGNIISTWDNFNGHGVWISGGTFIMQNGKIVCTNADAKAIYADNDTNVKLMNVWSNRELETTITNLITGGFTYDPDVE